MSQRTHKPYLNAIFERWKCISKSCKNFRKDGAYCYVLEDGTHAEFDRADGLAWEKAINRDDLDFITVENPPQVLVDSMVRKNRRILKRLEPRASTQSQAAPTPTSLTLGLDDIFKLRSILTPYPHTHGLGPVT